MLLVPMCKCLHLNTCLQVSSEQDTTSSAQGRGDGPPGTILLTTFNPFKPTLEHFFIFLHITSVAGDRSNKVTRNHFGRSHFINLYEVQLYSPHPKQDEADCIGRGQISRRISLHWKNGQQNGSSILM